MYRITSDCPYYLTTVILKMSVNAGFTTPTPFAHWKLPSYNRIEWTFTTNSSVYAAGPEVRSRHHRRSERLHSQLRIRQQMLIREDGSMLGTIGGGCVEAEVWNAARDVIETEKPRHLNFSLGQDAALR